MKEIRNLSAFLVRAAQKWFASYGGDVVWTESDDEEDLLDLKQSLGNALGHSKSSIVPTENNIGDALNGLPEEGRPLRGKFILMYFGFDSEEAFEEAISTLEIHDFEVEIES